MSSSPRPNGPPNFSSSPSANSSPDNKLNYAHSPNSPPNSYLAQSQGFAGPAERPPQPTRSATFGSIDSDRNQTTNIYIPQARSDDMNHGSSSNTTNMGFASPSPRPPHAYLSSMNSRPSTPANSNRPSNHPSASGHSDDLNHRAYDGSSHQGTANSYNSSTLVGTPPSGSLSQSSNGPGSYSSHSQTHTTTSDPAALQP